MDSEKCGHLGQILHDEIEQNLLKKKHKQGMDIEMKILLQDTNSAASLELYQNLLIIYFMK